MSQSPRIGTVCNFAGVAVAITPTSWSGAMNGGVSVEVGEGVYANLRPPPEYSMVFGPDGNLACYLRGITPKRPLGQKH